MMANLMVSCIVYAGWYQPYLRYQATSGWESLDPYSLVAALIILVIILSVIVGWLWPRGGGDRK